MRLGDKYRGYRNQKNLDELSVEFKEWVLAQDDRMKWDMMDTTFEKRHTWLFGRLVELFTATPLEYGGLPTKDVQQRYVPIEKNKAEQ